MLVFFFCAHKFKKATKMTRTVPDPVCPQEVEDFLVSSPKKKKKTWSSPFHASITAKELKDKYIADVRDKGVPVEWSIHPWYEAEPITMTCTVIDPSNKPRGFALDKKTQGLVDHYQYSKFPDHLKTGEIDSRYKPRAWRMPFLDHEHFYNKDWTVSHLCHNCACHNPEHQILEPLEVNKSRNGCPGGPACRHKVPCMLPGAYCES